MSHSKAIESFFLEGPAGKLEAVLNRGSETASHAALVCHPHPVYGGTLHNKVVFNLMKALNGFGPVLRFNFRGAGLSGGIHNNGLGEVEDARAALDWLVGEFHLPIIFAGFSFGAAIGLRAACPNPRAVAAISAGTPVLAVDTRVYDLSFLRQCEKPKLFISGEYDQYGPRPQLELLVESLPAPKQLKIIPGGDHFFEGHLPEFRQAVEGWVKQTLGEQISSVG